MCIVIPCYNEGSNFFLSDYHSFLEAHDDTMVCFVNDGSKDSTLQILQGLEAKFANNVSIVSYSKNQGKAEAVRRGFHYCHKNFSYDYIAYLDADLAVSLEECYSLLDYFRDDIQFLFGSRIQRIGSEIKRKRSRFIIGRIIATIISNALDLRVYDTQCGCKLFSKDIAPYLFDKPFISKWLFDVEIFFRLLSMYGKEQALQRMEEIPLKKWIDRGDSKVRFSYFFKLWVDLYSIRKKYKSKEN